MEAGLETGAGAEAVEELADPALQHPAAVSMSWGIQPVGAVGRRHHADARQRRVRHLRAGLESYQDGADQSGFRDLPDVSYDADPNTGVAVYDSVPYLGQSGWWVVGGTSLGAPSWSAILADADQLRAGAGKAPPTASDDAVQRDVYSLPASALAAVTSGPNGSCPVGCAPTAGYDTITGLGSPRAGIDAALANQ
jgi:hypothetical protein